MGIRFYHIADAALELLRTESLKSLPAETGGILVGTITEDAVTITDAIGPGQSAQHSATRFRRDGEESQRRLDAAVAASGGTQDYVGEWHSHPFVLGPSAIDAEAMGWIAKNPRYAIPRPVMALCTVASDGTFSVSIYLYSQRRLRRLHARPA